MTISRKSRNSLKFRLNDAMTSIGNFVNSDLINSGAFPNFLSFVNVDWPLCLNYMYTY